MFSGCSLYKVLWAKNTSKNQSPVMPTTDTMIERVRIGGGRGFLYFFLFNFIFKAFSLPADLEESFHAPYLKLSSGFAPMAVLKCLSAACIYFSVRISDPVNCPCSLRSFSPWELAAKEALQTSEALPGATEQSLILKSLKIKINGSKKITLFPVLFEFWAITLNAL